MRGRRVVGMAALAVALAGCSRDLPTAPDVQAPPGAVVACAGVGLDAFLRGNAADPNTAWIVGSDGVRRDVLFPAGYTAVFTPGLQVIDPAGRVVMAEGDYVYGACGSHGDKLLLAPEESLALDCGPVVPQTCRDNAPRAALGAQDRNDRVVAALRFTSADGDDVVTFEDGSTSEGTADFSG